MRGIRVLPDGRVGAIVEKRRARDPMTVQEANLHINERAGDIWILAEEIGSFIPDTQNSG